MAVQACAVLPDLEVVYAPASGFALLDLVLDVDRLVVVDSLVSGTAVPGTIHVVRDGDLPAACGPSPHYTGLWEVLALARALGLAVPRDVVIVAVEAADCTTMGGRMHPAVRTAVPEVVRRIKGIITEWQDGGESGCTNSL